MESVDALAKPAKGKRPSSRAQIVVSARVVDESVLELGSKLHAGVVAFRDRDHVSEVVLQLGAHGFAVGLVDRQRVLWSGCRRLAGNSNEILAHLASGLPLGRTTGIITIFLAGSPYHSNCPRAFGQAPDTAAYRINNSPFPVFSLVMVACEGMVNEGSLKSGQIWQVPISEFTIGTQLLFHQGDGFQSGIFGCGSRRGRLPGLLGNSYGAFDPRNLTRGADDHQSHCNAYHHYVLNHAN